MNEQIRFVGLLSVSNENYDLTICTVLNLIFAILTLKSNIKVLK